MKKIKKGDLVKLNSVDASRRAHGCNLQMREMVGHEFEVERTVHDDKITLKHNHTHESWTFHPNDLDVIGKVSDILSEAMPDKVMFDPKELII